MRNYMLTPSYSGYYLQFRSVDIPHFSFEKKMFIYNCVYDFKKQKFQILF